MVGEKYDDPPLEYDEGLFKVDTKLFDKDENDMLDGVEATIPESRQCRVSKSCPKLDLLACFCTHARRFIIGYDTKQRYRPRVVQQLVKRCRQSYTA